LYEKCHPERSEGSARHAGNILRFAQDDKLMEIISAKYLVSMEEEPLFDGAIAVENGEIMDVGLEEELLKRYPDAPHEDFPHHALLPGLVNAHAHLDLTHHKNFPFDPVRSRAVDVSFVDWLLSTIDYRKASSQEKLKSSVEEGIEMVIESGTTCVGDMGSYEGIFQSLEQAGMRAVIFPEILSYDPFVAKNLFETALAIVEKYMDMDSDLIGVGIGPYAPYLLSRNILKIMSQYCRSSNLPIAIHAAESFSELEFFYNSTGDIATRLFPNIGWGENLPPAHRKTPLEYLDEIDFLSSKPLLIGANGATPKDLDRVAKHGAKIVWAPRSQHYLKLGKAPIKTMLQKGITVALGTEGISSTNNLSMWDELRFAQEMEKEITPKTLLQMATRSGAAALGLEDDIGSLRRGKKADYIAVDISEFSGKGDLYAFLITQTKNYHVHKVVVNGQTVKTVN
ncbi:MAG: amidohydrolase family protein, partial [Deltaproteobacteria bacterium]|nr:amidohydrolase family protein [Deltaproteobacteria bacterium]